MDTKPDYNDIKLPKDFKNRMKYYREKWENEEITAKKYVWREPTPEELEKIRKEDEKEWLQYQIIIALCLIPLIILIVYVESIILKAIIFIPTIIIAMMSSASKAGKGK